MQDSKSLLNLEEAADYLTLKPAQLKKIRRAGDGPPEVWLSERVLRFRKQDLDLWIQSRVER